MTLLIACGVLLAAALLIVTGLVSGYLRQQTLESSEAGLLRVDAVLVEAGNRSLLSVEAVLSDIASHVRLADVPRPDAIARDIGEAAVGAHLDRHVEATPQIAGVALVGADGAVIDRAGGWPSAEKAMRRNATISVALRTRIRGLESAIERAMVPAPGSRAVSSASFPVAAQGARLAGGGSAGSRSPIVPVGEFEGFYRDVPLGADGIISLVRRDGIVLAQFPRQPDAAREAADRRGPVLKAMLADIAQGIDRGRSPEWRVAHRVAACARRLPGRGGRQPQRGRGARSAGRARRLLFGAFAVCGALAIGADGLSDRAAVPHATTRCRRCAPRRSRSSTPASSPRRSC